jgi:cytochrome b6-f complex iron-sulfur subunit
MSNEAPNNPPATPAGNPVQPPATAKEGILSSDVTRRGLLYSAWAAFVGVLAGSAAASARFMFPNVLYEPSQLVKLGSAKEFPHGVTVDKTNRLWIIRNDQGIYAIWSRCTHLGCTPNWFQAESRFKCPCHGSNFNIEGDVIAGPAPRALWRVAVNTTPEGNLVADKSIMEDRPGPRDKSDFFVTV